MDNTSLVLVSLSVSNHTPWEVRIVGILSPFYRGRHERNMEVLSLGYLGSNLSSTSSLLCDLWLVTLLLWASLSHFNIGAILVPSHASVVGKTDVRLTPGMRQLPVNINYAH